MAGSHGELNHPMSTLAREQPRSDMRPGSSKRFNAFVQPGSAIATRLQGYRAFGEAGVLGEPTDWLAP
jgi:hypothetical protein